VPIYSAKKINGKKLYEYAREGKTIELPVNNVEIFSLELLDITNDTITFKTLVSKGTYIRSLIEEICTRLNIIGSMSYLCRTKQGAFSIEDASSLEDIKNGNFKLLKAKDTLDYKCYYLNEEEHLKVKNGSKMELDSNEDYLILIYENEEIAIYKKENDLYRPHVMLI